MKKLVIIIPFLCATTLLQAPPKPWKNAERKTRTESIVKGGQSTPPLIRSPLAKEELKAPFPSPENSAPTSPLHASCNFAQVNEQQEKQQRLSPQLHAQATTEASACQTTMRTFSPPISTDDLGELVDQAEAKKLEEEMLSQQPQLKRAIAALGHVASITEDFLRTISQKELPLILHLYDKCKLTTTLSKFDTQSKMGAWLALGLNQAVESKSIDNTTLMLDIIHNHNLTDFIPTAHQNSAAQLLSEHNAKTISLLLPLTQRTTKVGGLSPRAKTVQESLQAARKAYGYDSENQNEHILIQELLSQIKHIKTQPTSSVATASITDKK